MNTLKELYGLSYDTSGFDSGLTNWYNSLIDRSYDKITISDVGIMIRQDVLKEVAIKKAVELFIDNPYCGEYIDGELIELLVQ